MSIVVQNEKKYMWIIGVLSVAIPLVVAILLFLPQTGKLGDFDVSFLPQLNAVLNTATSFCLIAALVAIKNKNVTLHRTLIMAGIVLSAGFLVSYVTYHFQAPPTHYGGEGFVKGLYFFVLLTHIVLAAAVVPLVLLSLYFAFTEQIDRHKKIVKFAYPIWLYVAITGPVVYLMISPYYSH